MHAQTFGTLTNTQVGIKEMVHRVFKGIVPKTNRKNIDLDLLKRYNTLFAIRHLVDGGIDPRFARSCAGFASSNFGNLFSNWYLTEDKFLNEESEDFDEAYTIIRGCFRHKANNEKYYAFVVVDWFEDINKNHPILGCPFYHLRTIESQRWRSIFPISAIDNLAQKVHFVHNCTNLECQDHYNSRNRIWIKNNYYFTAI